MASETNIEMEPHKEITKFSNPKPQGVVRNMIWRFFAGGRIEIACLSVCVFHLPSPGGYRVKLRAAKGCQDNVPGV